MEYDSFLLLTPPPPSFLVVSVTLPPSRQVHPAVGRGREREREESFLLPPLGGGREARPPSAPHPWVTPAPRAPCCSRAWHVSSTYSCGRRPVSSGGRRETKKALSGGIKKGDDFSAPLGAPFLAPILRTYCERAVCLGALGSCQKLRKNWAEAPSPNLQHQP